MAAAAFQKSLGLKIVHLDNPWARRRFVICVRGDTALGVPARLLGCSLRAHRSRFDGEPPGCERAPAVFPRP
jgi:hypothetical protein